MSRHKRFLPVAGLVTVLLAACTVPAVDEEPDTDDPDLEVADRDPTEGEHELRRDLEVLVTTVERARDALARASDATVRSTATPAGTEALAALLTDSDPAPDSDAALFPAVTHERGDLAASPDLLSVTLAGAREHESRLATRVRELLRDPVAGDLGGWQRDPAGMVALARDVASSATTLSRLERAVLELPGEGTRALAWTFVVVETDDVERAAAAAERAIAHLDLILRALEDAVTETEARAEASP